MEKWFYPYQDEERSAPVSTQPVASSLSLSYTRPAFKVPNADDHEDSSAC